MLSRDFALEMLTDLRAAHDRWLEVMGWTVRILERLNAVAENDFADDIARVRQERAVSETMCRQLEAAYRAQIEAAA